MDFHQIKSKFVVCCAIFYFLECTYAQEQWNLQRISADESRIVFKNTTVTGDFMLCSWMWKDSLGGIWDTRIRISFKNDSYKGGGFDYKDGYGRELLRVRWYQSAYQNLTWKAYFSSKFPPTPWNITGHYLTWGYNPISEYNWSFFIDNYTIEPKPLQEIHKFVNPYVIPMDKIAIAIRKKRSVNYRSLESSRTYDLRAFNIIDLFTGNGIFSQVPQMVINLFSFFSTLFPSGSNDYEVPDDIPTEPEAEVIPKSTTTIPSSTKDAPYVTKAMRLLKF